MSDLQQKLQAAGELGPAEAQALLKDIIVGNYPNDAESVKVKEQAIAKLTDLLVKQQDAAALASLLTELRPLFSAIPKAKTAKLVRTVIDSIAKVPGSTQLQVGVQLTGGEGLRLHDGGLGYMHRSGARWLPGGGRYFHLGSLESPC